MRQVISAALIAMLCSSMAQAGFITSTGATAFARNNDASLPFANDKQDVVSPNQVGYVFTTSVAITVNSLGLWDGPGTAGSPNGGIIGDGLEQDSRVTIYSGAVALASVVVPAGTLGGADEFAYAAITPLNLAVGTYTIAAEYNPGGNSFYNAGSTVPVSNGGTSALTTMSEITISGNRFGPQGSAPAIEDAAAGPGGYIEAYVGPSAEFVPVPEPSSFLFLGLIATSAFAWKRRQSLLIEAE